jgi:hypothetical protein
VNIGGCEIVGEKRVGRDHRGQNSGGTSGSERVMAAGLIINLVCHRSGFIFVIGPSRQLQWRGAFGIGSAPAVFRRTLWMRV